MSKNLVLRSGFFAALFIIAFGLFIYPTKVRAASSEVVVNICGLAQPLNINVQQPQTDTVVNKPRAVIKGQANQQAQLDVYLNGNHDNALSTESDGSFSVAVTLAQGTNTIKITGASFCGGTTNNITLVLTYTPGASNPNNEPGGVTTQIPGISYRTYDSSTQPNTGVVIKPKSESAQSSQKAPLKQRIQSILRANNDSVKRGYDILAVLLMIGGLTLIMLGLGLAGLFERNQFQKADLNYRLLISGGVLIVLSLLIFILMS